jgi:hypothetical protein
MSHLFNPTEDNYPYRKDDTLKDSQVSYDPALDIIVSTVPSLIPQTLVETSISQDIESHVEIVLGSGDITLTIKDRGTTALPIVIKNESAVSGTITLAAESGTLPQPTITFGTGLIIMQKADSNWTELP